MTGDWVMGIIGGVLIMLMGGGFFYVFSKIDALGTRLEGKFDAKIDTLDTKFEAKIDALDAKFEAKIDALDAKFDAKFDKQNEVIAGIAKDVAVILDRLHIDDRLARRYPSTKSQSEITQSQPETVESRLEAGV